MSILRTAVAALAVCLVGCGSPAIVDPQASPYWSDQDRLISVGDQTIRLRESGPDDARTVILLHGFTDSLHTWDPLVTELNDEFRILRPDLPGHGLSGPAPDEDYSNAALVDFVSTFIAETNADAPILVGNSLGGLAAWRAAAENPDTIASLVLLAPGGVPHNGVGDDPVSVPAMLRFYLTTAPEAGVRTALKAMHASPDTVTDERVNQYRDLMQGQGDAFVARAAQFTLPDPTADMARITAPTIVLWGADDTVLPSDHAAVFGQNIGSADVRILDGVGHLPQSEATDAVALAIRDIAAQMESDEE